MQLVSTILGMGPVLAKIIGETFQDQQAPVKELHAKMSQNNGHYAWLCVTSGSSLKFVN
jgi:hypothetical protein